MSCSVLGVLAFDFKEIHLSLLWRLDDTINQPVTEGIVSAS